MELHVNTSPYRNGREKKPGEVAYTVTFKLDSGELMNMTFGEATRTRLEGYFDAWRVDAACDRLLAFCDHKALPGGDTAS